MQFRRCRRRSSCIGLLFPGMLISRDTGPRVVAHTPLAQWFKPAFSGFCLLYDKACAAEAAGLHLTAGSFAFGDDLSAFKIGGFFDPVLL